MSPLSGIVFALVVLVSSCVSAPVPMSHARFDPVNTGSDASLRGISVVNARVIWASGSGGTVLRTTDGGQTWSHVHPSAEVDFRDIHAFDADTAFVMSITQPAFIERTTDGGATWTEVHRSAHDDAFFDSFTFVDRQRGYLFGDPVDGVFVILTTVDGGETWNAVAASDLPPALADEAGFAASGTCIASSGAEHAWVGTGGRASRVLVTLDGGATWSASNTPMVSSEDPSATQGIYSIAFRDATHGIIVGGDYSQPEQAARTAATTDDGGITWTPSERSPHGYRSGVAYVPGRGRTLVAVGRAGADYSEDDGRTWQSMGDEGYYAIAFAPDGAGWVVGADGRAARIGW